MLHKVCDYLNLLEKDYFGLSFRDHEDSRVRVFERRFLFANLAY